MSIGDTINNSAELETELRNMRRTYTKLSQKKPTSENIIKTLKINNAEGAKAHEVFSALNLIARDKTIGGDLVPEVLLCYIRNSHNWTVRSACVEALLSINMERGLQLSRIVLTDPNANLEVKLLTATHMVKAGELEGYSVLREGLNSTKPIEKALARDLLELFRKYDGVRIEATGETIDVQKLVGKVNTESDKTQEQKPSTP